MGSDADFFDNTGSRCCESVPFKCGAEADISPAVRDELRNIVLVVADDQGYCQYGFMHGTCVDGSRDGGDCRSNIDCPDGECESRTTGLSGSAPLRLSDFTCRYRQPPFPDDPSKQPCKYKGLDGDDAGTDPDPHPDVKGSKPGDRNSFSFHASKFPCTTTNPGGTPPAYPVPLTPYLDQLATHGAVFPRAYMGGNSCKPSRAVLLYGKPHRHLLEMEGDEVAKYSIATWLLKNGNNKNANPNDVPGNLGYWPFMVGKGEVFSESSAGFKGGHEKAKPKVAKYSCVANQGECQTAVTDASAHFLEVPDVARLGGYGIGDAFNTIEGRRGPNFTDRKVIKREASGVDCVACQTHETVNTSCDDECGSKLEHPFFLWFAPNQPHKRGRGEDYEGLYDAAYEDRRRMHEGRLTQMDQAVGALVDELKRHCICGWEVDPETGLGKTLTGGVKQHQKQSLWEHTVLIYLSDHGFLLPDAKRLDNENTHRTVLFVSEPNHRIKKADGQPLLGPRKHPDELVHASDVFRTVLDYAGVSFSGDPVGPNESSTYAYSRSIKAWVSGTPGSGSHIRDVLYGESAGTATMIDDVDRGAARHRYLITRAGELGFCIDNQAPGVGDPILSTVATRYDFDNSAHSKYLPKPCSIDGADDCPSGSECQAKNRCINDPSKLCESNADCVEVTTFCTAASGGRCKYHWAGSLGDMGRPVEAASGTYDSPSAACSYDANGTDAAKRASIADACVPKDVELCQPLTLKVKSKADIVQNAPIDWTWDIVWDPDERHDLLDPTFADPGYLGTGSGSLDEKFRSCLARYWTVASGNEWAGGGSCDWTEPGP